MVDADAVSLKCGVQMAARILLGSFERAFASEPEESKCLSKQLIEELGKGFNGRNLRAMRQFAIAFPIRNALCTELS